VKAFGLHGCNESAMTEPAVVCVRVVKQESDVRLFAFLPSTRSASRACPSVAKTRRWNVNSPEMSSSHSPQPLGQNIPSAAGSSGVSASGIQSRGLFAVSHLTSQGNPQNTDQPNV
jgi:hypothetical protein